MRCYTPRTKLLLAAIVLVGALPTIVLGQASDGTAPSGTTLFQERCAACHASAATSPSTSLGASRAPALDALRTRSPQAILDALLTGSMRSQGARLSGPERRAVAEFISGRALGGDVRGDTLGRCITLNTTAPATNATGTSATGSAAWTGWSPSSSNTRAQPAAHAGLDADTVPKLALKWAFGFPDASVAWAPPTVLAGRLYVGSQNGTVYALDAASGCIHWVSSASGGVRTAVVLDGGVAYFGDTSATAYAVDAQTGRTLWTRRVDEHPMARITGSPVVANGRLYVPMSSYEESQGADPSYPCCTFRGSLTALDTRTGAIVWKTHIIPETPHRRGTSSAGVPLWGPSGAAIWSSPSIDLARRRVYVATGNAYSAPAHAATDAVVALDLESGAIIWARQTTPGDVYVTGCRAGNPNCPEINGPDLDFGSPPMLVGSGGRDLIVIGQKSGVAYALDPDREGAVVWQYRVGAGGLLGGIEWGAAADSVHAYFAVSDITQPAPGGLHAVQLATGTRAWYAAPRPTLCAAGRGCSAAQSAPVTVIPGVVFSGAMDGGLRAYSTTDGAVLWEFNTNREFVTVNGVPATGASIGGAGPVVAGGMVFVGAGYGAFGGRPGNVLLAFAVE